MGRTQGDARPRAGARRDQQLLTRPERATWDPERYERFRAERSQPFHDLLARLPATPVRFAADLGCGTGELTQRLAERWPSALIWGVDSSPEMLRKAQRGTAGDRLTFVEADLRSWLPNQPLDVIVSNAALQWLPDHASLIPHLCNMLAPGGILAVQIPNNRAEPAYRILLELLAEPAWRQPLAHAAPVPSIESPAWYTERLTGLGMKATVWETIYYHQLPDADAVVAWMEGTVMRPALTALSETDGQRLRDVLSVRVARAYPRAAFGVLFPFRRLFFLAQRGER